MGISINLCYLYFNIKLDVFYRLIPYGCLSTGKELGLIECVRDALTIMDIQSKTISGAIQINSSNLHRWIKENNKEK